METFHQSPWVVVGLGNPGPKYQSTWHNIGFSVIDSLTTKYQASSVQNKFHAEIAQVEMFNKRVVLLKPMTFMNRSGLAVGEAVRFYKVDISQRLLVVVDDLDLPEQQLRLRKAGGSGGHNGLKSIEQVLGRQDYPRLRIGIGRSEQLDPAAHVLAKLSKKDQETFCQSVELATGAVELCIRDEIEAAMNAVNQRTQDKCDAES